MTRKTKPMNTQRTITGLRFCLSLLLVGSFRIPGWADDWIHFDAPDHHFRALVPANVTQEQSGPEVFSWSARPDQNSVYTFGYATGVPAETPAAARVKLAGEFLAAAEGHTRFRESFRRTLSLDGNSIIESIGTVPSTRPEDHGYRRMVARAFCSADQRIYFQFATGQVNDTDRARFFSELHT